MDSNETIEVTVPDCRERFTLWIKTRKGVQVWRNQDPSNPGAGQMFTPADRTEEGPPHWAFRKAEVIKDLGRFRFIKEMKELKRFRVALRRGAQGLKIKLTDASSRKVRAACDKVKDSRYWFDYETQEAVIEIPVWEE